MLLGKVFYGTHMINFGSKKSAITTNEPGPEDADWTCGGVPLTRGEGELRGGAGGGGGGDVCDEVGGDEVGAICGAGGGGIVEASALLIAWAATRKQTQTAHLEKGRARGLQVPLDIVTAVKWLSKQRTETKVSGDLKEQFFAIFWEHSSMQKKVALCAVEHFSNNIRES